MIVSVGTLVVAAVGALVTEFAGIAGVAALFGILGWAAILPAGVFLIWLVLAGTYRRVEVVGIVLGLAELAFVVAAIVAHPQLPDLAHGLSPLQPLGHTGYLALVAANIGAVVMPWMVFYQQGAVIDKGLGPRDLRAARVNTAIGACATQVVMASVLIAAAVGLHGRTGSLRSVGGLAVALSPVLGSNAARLVLTAGILGASLVAAIVVSVALAWAIAEACERPRSLDDSPRRAPLFYAIYTAAVALGAGLVLGSTSLVRLAVHVEILNAALLPLVLGFLVLLAFRVLPRPDAPALRERVALAGTVAAVVAIGLLSIGLSFGL